MPTPTRPTLRRGRPDHRRGRAVPGGGADRLGQVHAAAGRQRAGAPLHRGPPLGRRSPSTVAPPGTIRPGSWPTWSDGGPGPGRQLRDRHRRGRAGLHHGEPGLAPAVMRRRVEDTLDLLGLHELRHRPLATLSGGQQQRVAIGAVLTAAPRVLVLDEPTSALDPAAAEEVLAALTRLVHDVGMTVLIAEHRLERVVPYADRVVLLPGDGAALVVGAPAEIMATLAGGPAGGGAGPVGRVAPLPLSVRDARRLAGPLRQRLAGAEPPDRRDRPPGRSANRSARAERVRVELRPGAGPATGSTSSCGAGEVVAVMGRNGSGKSTLLAHLAGLRTPSAGPVDVDGASPPTSPAAGAIRGSAWCPRTRHCCSTATRWPPSAQRPTTTPAWPPGPPPPLDRILPGSAPGPAPPRPVRGPAPGPGPGHRAGPGAAAGAARRAHPRPRLSGQGPAGRRCSRELAADGHAWSWPPTTWSWWPRWPPGWWCWPRARWWPTDRPARWCATRRCSPPRWPRCWRRSRG